MGFGRDKSVDSGGYRGVIPENTSVPVVMIECNPKLVPIKNGDNAGKTSRLYSCVFEVLAGKYEGGRVWHDIWCNVEPDPAGGDPEVFGSHSQFCDVCDIRNLKEDDGSYPLPTNDDDIKKVANALVGTSFIAVAGIRTFTRRDQTTGETNTIKSIIQMNEAQMDQISSNIAAVMDKVAKQQARRKARDGASGFEDEDGNEIF